jgi:putative FmdB family regulatory protein
MPIYEYQCTACQHQLEAFQSLSEASLTDCPACHQAALTKLISAAGFQLKGSGWYLTDYSAKGKRKTTEATTSTEGSKSSGEAAATKSEAASSSSDSSTSSNAGAAST